MHGLVGELLAVKGGGDAFYLQPRCRRVHYKSRGATSPQRRALWVQCGEEGLDIARVSKHPDSEDESVGVGVVWDS